MLDKLDLWVKTRWKECCRKVKILCHTFINNISWRGRNKYKKKFSFILWSMISALAGAGQVGQVVSRRKRFCWSISKEERTWNIAEKCIWVVVQLDLELVIFWFLWMLFIWNCVDEKHPEKPMCYVWWKKLFVIGHIWLFLFLVTYKYI